MSSSSDPDPRYGSTVPGPGRTPWYQDTRVIAVLLLLVGLLALPLVWLNKTYTPKKKILITLIAVTVAGVLMILGSWLLGLVEQQNQAAQEQRSALLAPSEPAATAGSVL